MKKDKNEIALTSSELCQVELSLTRRINKKLILEKQDLLLNNVQLQMEVYKLKVMELSQKYTSLKEQKNVNLKQYMLADKEYKEYVQRLTDKYEIEDKNWGYDPDTGKIIFNE